MGIDLGDVVIRESKQFADLRGQTVAIDAWNVLYQFLSSLRQRDGTPLLNARGEITSHLSGALQRSLSLIEAEIEPVWVFDGQAHELKKETLAARRERREKAEQDWQAAKDAGDEETAQTKARQSSRMTWAMADQAADLLEAMGVPVVRALGEGEAQAAVMAKQGIVDASASQDFDSLLFGAPRLIRNLTSSGRRKLPGKQDWVPVLPEEIPLARSLDAMALTREQLVDAAILVGTDFNPGVKGVGAKKAIKLVQEHGSLEGVLDASTTGTSAVLKAIHEEQGKLADHEAVRKIFLEPDAKEVEAVKRTKPDGDRMRAILQDHDFDPKRIDDAIRRLAKSLDAGKQASLFGF